MPAQIEIEVDGLFSASTTLYGDDVITVSFAGELDAATIPAARGALEAAVRADPPLLVIDLHALEFLDSSGIAVLVALSEARDPETLRLVPSPVPAVTRILDATGVGSTIPVAAESNRATIAA
jgi:anti-sigma B factor antagonist